MNLPKSVTENEFVLLMRSFRKSNLAGKVACLLAYESGLRLSEVRALTPLNIQKNMIEVVEGKGGKSRVVPLPKGWRAGFITLLPIKKTGRSLQRNFKTAAKKAGLSPFYTFHSLRHGFATRLLEKGVPINQVQLLMGHSDISTTGIYLKARPLDALKSYEEYF
jgi:integrase/recombinase XerD